MADAVAVGELGDVLRDKPEGLPKLALSQPAAMWAKRKRAAGARATALGRCGEPISSRGLVWGLATGPALGPLEARRQPGFVAAACKVELLLFEARRLRQVSSRNECQVEVGAR